MKKTDLKSSLCELLQEDERSEKVDRLLKCLLENGVRDITDLQYLDRSSLEDFGTLTNEEIDFIVNITKETLEEALEGIFLGENAKRIEEISKCLQENGVTDASDLKFFDWSSLAELNVLSDMEIKKIMQYVAKNFPKEYREHREKYMKSKEIQMETDLLEHKIQFEKGVVESQRNSSKSEYNNEIIPSVSSDLDDLHGIEDETIGSSLGCLHLPIRLLAATLWCSYATMNEYNREIILPAMWSHVASPIVGLF